MKADGTPGGVVQWAMPKTPKPQPPKLDKRLTKSAFMAELDDASAAAERGELIAHAAIVRWSKSLGTTRSLPRPTLKRAGRKAS
jgi:hypothetical protein